MENMHIAFSPPDITEEEIAEVVDTLRSGWITTGPKTKLFEKQLAEYIGTNRVVCLNSATACQEMTLRLLGIGPGDEVITTAYTYTASASVVEHVGAKLVLVDVAKDSYEMDYEKLADAITEKTKAIIPIHLYGQCANMDRSGRCSACIWRRAKRKEMWTGCRFHKLFLPCGKEPDDSGRWCSHMASDRRCG